MNQIPKFHLVQGTQGHSQAFLLTKGGKLPQVKIPAHLVDHPALKGERGSKIVLHSETSTLSVLGIGSLDEFTPQEAAELGEAFCHFLKQECVADVSINFPSELKSRDSAFCFLRGMAMGNYRLDELRTGESPKRSSVNSISINESSGPKLSHSELAQITALCSGISFARDLIELPPNLADPVGITKRFQAAIDTSQLELEIWDEKKIKAEGMGLIEAVGQGSPHSPPRFLIVRYGKRFRGTKPSVYFVGKGVTFDTGGVNLKVGSWADLADMKKDMSGAAAVLGAMLTLSELKPEVSVVGVTPLTSNCLGSTAMIPSDIFRSYSGKTVEVLNTDAEGRLILADALHFAVKEKADYIFDTATLTGACVVALGHYHAGLFSNDEKLQSLVQSISTQCGEPTWPMPMSPRYGDELKSKIADLKNMGKGREGGAILGAKFLENFVGKTPWCHIDIAGTHDLLDTAAGGAQLKAAGRMVHTFVELAKHFSAS